jgi:hypothetical protein
MASGKTDENTRIYRVYIRTMVHDTTDDLGDQSVMAAVVSDTRAPWRVLGRRTPCSVGPKLAYRIETREDRPPAELL